MAKRFHKGKDGSPKECTAEPGKCPLGGEHFDSFEACEAAIERDNASNAESKGTSLRKPNATPEVRSFSTADGTVLKSDGTIELSEPMSVIEADDGEDYDEAMETIEDITDGIEPQIISTVDGTDRDMWANNAAGSDRGPDEYSKTKTTTKLYDTKYGQIIMMQEDRVDYENGEDSGYGFSHYSVLVPDSTAANMKRAGVEMDAGADNKVRPADGKSSLDLLSAVNAMRYNAGYSDDPGESSFNESTAHGHRVARTISFNEYKGENIQPTTESGTFSLDRYGKIKVDSDYSVYHFEDEPEEGVSFARSLHDETNPDDDSEDTPAYKYASDLNNADAVMRRNAKYVEDGEIANAAGDARLKTIVHETKYGPIVEVENAYIQADYHGVTPFFERNYIVPKDTEAKMKADGFISSSDKPVSGGKAGSYKSSDFDPNRLDM